jgi:hypothetical protein
VGALTFTKTPDASSSDLFQRTCYGLLPPPPKLLTTLLSQCLRAGG